MRYRFLIFGVGAGTAAQQSSSRPNADSAVLFYLEYVAPQAEATPLRQAR
jgi:hypothetical protein